jgi:hypothetical protein
VLNGGSREQLKEIYQTESAIAHAVHDIIKHQADRSRFIGVVFEKY